MILVGTGGQSNLDQHRGRSKCLHSVKKQKDEAKAAKIRTLFDVGLAKRPDNSSDAVVPRIITSHAILPASQHTIPIPKTHGHATMHDEDAPETLAIPVTTEGEGAILQPIMQQSTGTKPRDTLYDVARSNRGEAIVVPTKKVSGSPFQSETPKTGICEWLRVPIPEGMTPYTAYPFGMHGSRVLPWNVRIVDAKLYLQSTECSGSASARGMCTACKKLHTHDVLRGIIDRMKRGIHENTPHQFQPISGLMKIIEQKSARIDLMRMERLNAARKLTGRPGGSDDIANIGAPEQVVPHKRKLHAIDQMGSSSQRK
jgi:hypothetical protein